MTDTHFPDRTLDELLARPRAVLDADTMRRAAEIVADVEIGGEDAALRHAAKFDGFRPGDQWLLDRAALDSALERIPVGMREDLEGAADRIGAFARAQRAALTDLDVAVPGGRAGHTVIPVQRAGCYAPAGRFPLPSSLLMGVVTARAAGVPEVWVASPRPSDTMLAAAAIAGATGVIGLGGAQAIAALAFGIGSVEAVDVVVGPGNRWVTAAKQAVSGRVGIDFLAGPSELVVLADGSADADVIAADLIAQAEHDADALPILVTTDARLVVAVREALGDRLESLPAAAVAREALSAGGAIRAESLEAAIALVDRLAPEHLQLSVEHPEAVAAQIGSAGAIFLGEQSAEVFGDYGAGPNHVLPTSGGARFTAGLSVFTFLRARSWLRIDDPTQLGLATARLARLEGLEGHARAAEARPLP
ncbi:MAG TPA: histidinol dehydrogenase [Gemmatimonadales bacterium]|nr:histidinol dehydrogenase [Gemmatimonadales bacterium]